MGQGRHKEENITRRQAEVMQEICRFFSTYGKMPRMQQLADAFGISVPSIYDILQELVSKGYLKRIEKGATKPYVINKAVEPEALVTVQIPVLGEIPAVCLWRSSKTGAAMKLFPWIKLSPPTGMCLHCA